MKWEKIFADATRLKLLNIQRHRALYDFLNAFRTIDVTLVIDKKIILKNKINRNENFSTLKNLLKNFRNQLRTTRALILLMIDDNNHEAFITLQKNLMKKRLIRKNLIKNETKKSKFHHAYAKQVIDSASARIFASISD